MSIPFNLYQCHKCGHEWSAQAPLLQSDGCSTCGQSHVAPIDDGSMDHPDIVEVERSNGMDNAGSGDSPGFDCASEDDFENNFQ